MPARNAYIALLCAHNHHPGWGARKQQYPGPVATWQSRQSHVSMGFSLDTRARRRDEMAENSEVTLCALVVLTSLSRAKDRARLRCVYCCAVLLEWASRAHCALTYYRSIP